MQTHPLGLGLAALMALPACAPRRADLSDGLDGAVHGDAATARTHDARADIHATLDVGESQLSGSVGYVRGFAGGVWLEHGEDHADVSTVSIHARDISARWAVLAKLTFRGGIARAELAPGASFEFGATTPYSRAGLHISLLGCSGPSEASWAFDRSADLVGVRVRQGSEPGTRLLVFEATWLDWPAEDMRQTVTGSFEYRVPSAPGAGDQ